MDGVWLVDSTRQGSSMGSVGQYIHFLEGHSLDIVAFEWCVYVVVNLMTTLERVRVLWYRHV